jgi:hypothetical protein
MDTTGTAYDINTITWQSGNTIRIAFNGTPDLSAVAADDYFVTSGNANSSNDGTFQISAVNDGSDYIDIINLNRSDATDDEATDAVGTGYYTLEEWDGVSKNMHVRFDGTSWISVTPSAGYTCYDITSGNILIFDGTDWSTTITTSGSVATLSEVLTAGNATGANNIDLATGQRVAYAADDNDDWVGISATGSTATLMAQGSGIPASATQIDLTKSAATITSTAGAFAGLEEASDYSANYSALSLVNKTYADALVSGLGTLSNVVEDTTPQLGGDLDVQTNEIISTGSNNIGLHSNASAYVELGDNLGTNTFDIRDNASGIKLQILSTGDTGIGKSTSLSTAWLSISTSNNNRAHINLEGSSVDKTTPVDGDLWYNTTAGTLNFYDGSTTTDLLSGGGVWTDNGGGHIEYSATDTVVEITDGTANTFGTASLRSNGNLLVGNGNTFGGTTTTISGLAVIGDSNVVGASTGASIGNGLVVGGSNTVPQMINGSVFGANNSITGGTGSLVFMMGNSHTTDSVTTVLIGDNNETLANDTVTVGHDLIARTSEQMVFGRRIDLPTASYLAGTYLGHGNASNSQPLLGIVRPATQTGKNVGNIGIGFGASTLYITGKNNAGDGILYIGNLVNQATEPTVTVQDSVGIWAKDRAGGGTAGLKMQVEDGTNHFLGDFSAIGGDETVANANKTLTVAGTGTGSGTSSLLCEDSAGTTTFEVKDNGTVEAKGVNVLTESLIIAVSDESTPLTTGTAKITFRMPYAFTLTDVRASLTTAGGTSGTTTIDINESGVSVLSTKLTIDFAEKTSTTAATAVVISDSALADDAEITIDIDAITGGATEAGLKVYLIGNRA